MNFTPDQIFAFLTTLAADPVFLGAVLAAFTFLTEDGALIAGSLLVGSNQMGQAEVILWLVTGILLGDLVLYLVGALARETGFVHRILPKRRLVRFRRWLNNRQTGILFATRFLPGTRLPTYLAYGYLRLDVWRFLWVLALAGAVWVTGVVLFVSETQQLLAQHGNFAVAALAGGLLALALVALLPRLMRRLFEGNGFTPPPAK